jgi:hypothetical protein
MRKAELEMVLVRAIEHAVFTAAPYHGDHAPTGPYFHYLQTYKLWPTAEEVQMQSISTIFSRMVPKNLCLFSPTHGTCQSYNCACSPSRFRDALINVENLLSPTKRGLCLDCVKTVGKSRQEKLCRFCTTP